MANNRMVIVHKESKVGVEIAKAAVGFWACHSNVVEALDQLFDCVGWEDEEFVLALEHSHKKDGVEVTYNSKESKELHKFCGKLQPIDYLAVYDFVEK